MANRTGFYISIFVFALIATSVKAQLNPNIQKVLDNAENYYYGEACSQNQQEAEEYATTRLLSSISVKVSSDFRSFQKIDGDANNVEYERKVENVIKTYASASLNDLKDEKEPRDCGIYVLKYIDKSSVESIFNYRKQLVKDMYDKAERYEGEGNYAHALKYYYFSSILLNSIPVAKVEHNGLNLGLEIGDKISNIMNSARFEVLSDKMESDKKRVIVLGITVDGKPAKTLDFEFWDGNNNVSAKTIDGTASIVLLGSSVQFPSVKIRVKYAYYEYRNEMKEVGELWNLVNKLTIPGDHTIDLREKPKKKAEEFGLAPINDNLSLKYTSSIGEVVENVNELAKVNPGDIEKMVPGQLESLENYFNKNTRITEFEKDTFLSDKLAALKKYNNLDLSEFSSRSDVNNTYDGWEFRQLTSNAHYPSLNIQSKEYLIPDFDSSGTMTDVNFGIMDGLYDDFKRASTFGDDWDKRQVIIKFVEKYRTAYMTRDLEQLGVMFADEAVIIVGRVLRVDESDSKEFAGDENAVEYMEMTKTKFLDRQETIFKSQRDIHLGFTTFDIKKKNGENGVYGVAMRQAYTSSGYSDEGYLFLLIDFNGTEPKIYVRAWQPNEWSEDKILQLANFRVNF